MKKLALLAFLAVLGPWAFGADPVPYDSSAVKDLMHSNQAALGAVSKALNAGDWKAAGEGFAQFGQNALKMRSYAPPKGSAAEWTKIWDDFQAAAAAGAEAARAQDLTKAKAALDRITADRNAGHPKFR